MFGKINETLATFSPIYLARTGNMPEVASKVLLKLMGCVNSLKLLFSDE